MKEFKISDLRLRDVCIGDWVKVWIEDFIPHFRFMKITSINENGMVSLKDALDYSFATSIDNIEGIILSESILKDFGFYIEKFEALPKEYSYLKYNGKHVGLLVQETYTLFLSVRTSERIYYLHELMAFMDGCGMDTNLTYKQAG